VSNGLNSSVVAHSKRVELQGCTTYLQITHYGYHCDVSWISPIVVSMLYLKTVSISTVTQVRKAGYSVINGFESMKCAVIQYPS
jgi:hypothetical protein